MQALDMRISSTHFIRYILQNMRNILKVSENFAFFNIIEKMPLCNRLQGIRDAGHTSFLWRIATMKSSAAFDFC